MHLSSYDIVHIMDYFDFGTEWLHVRLLEFDTYWMFTCFRLF